MKRLAALFPIVFALGAITLAPGAGARADAREEGGPFEIEKCQTIDKPGSYKLVNNLTFTGPNGGTCLSITASFVTIDLAGFTISGPVVPPAPVPFTTAIAAADSTIGIAVRNGSIFGFTVGVKLDGTDSSGSIVEGLRISRCAELGIAATGIVRGNSVVGCADGPGQGIGISATGVIIDNYVFDYRAAGIVIGPGNFSLPQGSTVIGNTAAGSFAGAAGITVFCPSNVTNNTAVNNPIGGNLVLVGTGCNNTNNVAP